MSPSETGFLDLLQLALTPSVKGTDIMAFLHSGLSADDFSLKHCRTKRETLTTAKERAAREAEFICRKGVRTFFITDSGYPELLRKVPEAPPVIFAKGDFPSSFSQSLSVVGTRHATRYGMQECESLIKELRRSFPDMWIVSGLAYGIDACAHSSALKEGLGTMAVVAHGLDTIYPAAHRNLANGIVENGGVVITRYPSGTPAYRPNFLERNKIIAGVSEGTFVVESDVRGGAMSTARSAAAYGRKVLALPGRTTDHYSSGCLSLITRRVGEAVCSARGIADIMGWKTTEKDVVQQTLFPELTIAQQRVFDIIRDAGRELPTDEINVASGIDMPLLLTTLFELEMAGLIRKFPGERYGPA